MDIKEVVRPGYCPYCNTKTGSNQADLYYYGSPVRTCGKCKQQYLNRCYHEIAVEGYRDTDVSIEACRKNLRNGILLVAAAAAMNGALYLLGRYSWVFLLFVVLGAAMLLVSLKDYWKVRKGTRLQELEKEEKASVARLRNPEYARLLQAHGYEVPEEYLPQMEE